jgi:hypothetical protein
VKISVDENSLGWGSGWMFHQKFQMWLPCLEFLRETAGKAEPSLETSTGIPGRRFRVLVECFLVLRVFLL